jgi:glycosyltransferase involved in cell wall biosynthesis
MRRLPDVHLYVTGDTSKPAAARFIADPPRNVTFTGFLDPNGQYLGLLRAVDAVMVLTTRNHTLQLGGCEAVAVGKPLMTSDWPYLRELFQKGAVYVGESAAGIREGIVALREQRERLTEEVLHLRRKGRHAWDERLGQLERAVGEGDRRQIETVERGAQP